MKTQINRKAFLQVSLATTLVGLVGCSGDETPGGEMTGTGGDGTGTGGAGTGGAGTGGAGTGGDSATGGNAATGGDSATGGNAATGGDSATGGAGTGGDGTGGEPGGLTCDADIVVYGSGATHTHSLTVTAAQLNAGVAVSGLVAGPAMDLNDHNQSTAGNHTHPIPVDLTAQDIATLKAGGVVKLVSCDNHAHEYVLSCDPEAPEPTLAVCN